MSPLLYSKPAKIPVPFRKFFHVPLKSAKSSGSAAQQTRSLEREKVLTPTGFFAILYKVYRGDVSKWS